MLEKQEVLSTLDLSDRIDLLMGMLNKEQQLGLSKTKLKIKCEVIWIKRSVTSSCESK